MQIPETVIDRIQMAVRQLALGNPIPIALIRRFVTIHWH